MIYVKRLLYFIGAVILLALFIPLCTASIPIAFITSVVIYVKDGGAIDEAFGRGFDKWGNFFFENYYTWYTNKFNPDEKI